MWRNKENMIGTLALFLGVSAGWSLGVPQAAASTVTEDFVKIYRLEPKRGAQYQAFLTIVCGRVSVEVSAPGEGLARVSHLGSVEVGVNWLTDGLQNAVSSVYAESLIRRILQERVAVCQLVRNAVDQVGGSLAPEGIRRGTSSTLQGALNEAIWEESSDPQAQRYFPRMRFVFPGAIDGSRFAGEYGMGLEVKRYGSTHYGSPFHVSKACDHPTPFEFIGEVNYPERVQLALGVSPRSAQAGDTPEALCRRVARALP